MTIFQSFLNVIEFLTGKVTELENKVTQLNTEASYADDAYKELENDYIRLSDKAYILCQKLNEVSRVVPRVTTCSGVIEVSAAHLKLEGPIVRNDYQRCHHCGQLFVAYHRNGFAYCCKHCADSHLKFGRSPHYKHYICEFCGDELDNIEIKRHKDSGNEAVLCTYCNV